MRKYARLSIILLAFLLLAACSKSKTHFHDLSTPANAFKTVFTTIKEEDAEGFKSTLSARTLQFVEEESKRTGMSAQTLLSNYVSRRHEENRTESTDLKEEWIDENTVEFRYRANNVKSLTRFTREDNQWKMDGFGSPMKSA